MHGHLWGGKEGGRHLTYDMLLTEQEHEETTYLIQALVETCEWYGQAADQTAQGGCVVFFGEGF